MNSVVLDKIQGKINNIARAYAAQQEISEPMSDSENNSDVENGPGTYGQLIE